MVNVGDRIEQDVINLLGRIDRKFKTNPSFRLEKKIIITSAWRGVGGWNHYRRADAEVRDLDRIFHLLDGRAPKDHLADAAATVAAARRSGLGQKVAGEVETEYFTFRPMVNGNLHVVFKRPDLVRSVNGITAAHFGATLGHDRRKRRAA